MNMPLVSVITPAWNAAESLAGTVASVRAQSFGDWEMLLIDDGSTDGSAALAADLAAGDARIRALGLGANRGAAEARNTGIRAARGRFIAFLDADDRWRPEKLARQLDFIGKSGHAFAFASYQRRDAQEGDLGVVAAPARVAYADILKGNPIGCLTAIYDTQVFGKVEMPDLRRRQDLGLWLRLLRRVPHAHGLNEVLADYRVSPRGLSANKLVAARATWRLYRDVERLAWPRASYYFAHYAAHGLLGRLGARQGKPGGGH